MKKITRLLIVISFAITMYTIFFWQPKENNNYEIKEKSEQTFSNDLEKNINVDNARLKETAAKSIFKINEETLKNSIPEEDKAKADEIINSMSEVDIDRIKREESNVNKEEGIRNKFKLLSRRLSSKDYGIIKSIYNKYIDFTDI